MQETGLDLIKRILFLFEFTKKKVSRVKEEREILVQICSWAELCTTHGQRKANKCNCMHNTYTNARIYNRTAFPELQ